MLALLYLITSFLAGLAIVQRFFPSLPSIVRLAGGFVAGIAITVWVTFLVAFGLSPFTDNSLVVGILIALGVHGAVIGAWGEGLRPSLFRLTVFEAVFVGACVLFSFWLMDQRLTGDPLTVSANTWGDTALHVALARSFSWGHNYPPEYPFFANDPIRYHFGYDFFAGALERGGLPIEYAFNLPGALGFSAMMMLVFALGRMLFRSVAVGLIAVALLITNASLAFIRFYQQYDNNIVESVKHLWHHDVYLAVGPYFVNGKIDKIAIYWTLNVFLTQTHLIVAMALVLFVAYGLFRPLREGRPLWTQEALVLGVVFGISFWLNGVLFIAAMVCFVALFFVYGRNLRMLPYLIPGWVALMLLGSKVDGHFYFAAFVYALGAMFLLGRLRESIPFLVVAGLLALPQAVWLNGGLNSSGSIRETVAYLVCSSPQASCHDAGFNFLTPSHYWDFAEYWWLNLGLTLPLMIVAAVWGSKSDRKLMLAVMAIFIFGNFVQLSRDLGGHNHKVFNLWDILMKIFVAFALVKMWNIATKDVTLGSFKIDARSVRYVARAAVPVLFFLIVLSGIIDFMTIKNDPHYDVFGDKQEAITWINDNTPGDAVFLTSYGDLYTAPTLAGRRVYLGYEPWAGSAGYDVDPRRAEIARIYNAQSKTEACRMLRADSIDFVELGSPETTSGRFPVNQALFRQFTPANSQPLGGAQLNYYDVRRSCPAGSGAGG